MLVGVAMEVGKSDDVVDLGLRGGEGVESVAGRGVVVVVVG